MAIKVVQGVEETAESLKSNIGRLDTLGREIVDGRPMEPPLGYKRQPTLVEQIREMVRGEALRRATEAAGAESFEESDDFDVGDDYDPSSPYEEYFEPTPMEELQERARKAAEAEAALPPKPVPAEPVKPPEAAGDAPKGP